MQKNRRRSRKRAGENAELNLDVLDKKRRSSLARIRA
jgi:hypothetical protein